MKRHIAILGTRGIPNRYGGFEQLAEHLAEELVKRGHKITVFNSSLHPFRENVWKGANIVRAYDPENYLGSFGQFIYDFHCIWKLRKIKPDVVLQLGYTSSSVWYRWIPDNTLLVTNMDGMEWKRSKYSDLTKNFLRYAEKLAVKSSSKLVADSVVIKKYLSDKYLADAAFIPYGATEFLRPDPGIVERSGLKVGNYFMLMARMEPENNIEMVLKGFEMSKSGKSMLVVGNMKNSYGKYIEQKFGRNASIRFTGAIYDAELLNQFRYHSLLYFHGHSVGGTNPSLLEAMASCALVAAHDNEFNRAVLGNWGRYFKDHLEVSELMDREIPEDIRAMIVERNLEQIRLIYNWKNICDQYENILIN